MNSASKPFQFALLLTSAAMICGAAALWSNKSRVLSEREALAERAQLQERRMAQELLVRSYRADNALSYSALSSTVAYIGGKNLESTAQVTRAPRHLAIKMLSGPMSGVQSGYSQRWFWRQDAGKAMKPYAEVALDANKMAAKRFALLTKNYNATLSGREKLDGRLATVIELWPAHPVDGARGPARRLYIDEQSGLTLRTDAFNCDLRPVMRSTLSKLDLHPTVKANTFEPPALIFASLKKDEWRGEELGSDYKKAAQKTGFLPPHPSYLPPGFELDGYGIHRCRTTGVLQLASFTRYTDGLNTLTVFAFKPVNQNIENTMRGACDFGPGAMSSREDGAGRLMALGDLPPKTLENVLASAKFETTK
jgi:negative regulator of sigma E activity